jgi:hypothetical protein
VQQRTTRPLLLLLLKCLPKFMFFIHLFIIGCVEVAACERTHTHTA